MTIRIRLTLLFGLIVSGLWCVFCLLIYFSTQQYRQMEFRERLRAEAHNSVELLFAKEIIPSELFRLLDKNQLTVLYQEEIIIYNAQNQIVYESGTDYLNVSAQILDQVRREKEIYWQNGNREIVGVAYTDSQKQLVVFASAIDRYGFSKMQNQAFVLFVGGLLMSLVVFVAGWFYSGRVLKPIQRMITGIDAITASELNVRLPEGDKQDELMQLSHRFNQMLDRLEEAFRVQRSFVAHASHELRTPLTAITGQIQVALLAKDDPGQLYIMLESILEDVREMNQLTHGLLMLTSLNIDEQTRGFTLVSLNELLGQIRHELNTKYPNYHIHISLPENHLSADWNLLANEVLLRTAFWNLMENGCKFSPQHTVWISLQVAKPTLKTEKGSRIIVFHTKDSFIPAADLSQVVKPFYRGSNAHQVAGHGIGLSLTDRIIGLHQGQLLVESAETTGTVFTVILPVRTLE